MSGSSLRRTVLCILVIALLLPLASAFAAPVRGKETRIQLPDWNRIVLQPLNRLLDLFRPVTENASMPPGHKPGNGDGDGGGNDGKSRDGSGLDPHGKP
ncbi:MAG TPA: hypothetical protein VFR31_07670 [Thermoanaerobaculia bacterium]|nr:hypothetical protein [Thermoanaerobaculia bacterium]